MPVGLLGFGVVELLDDDDPEVELEVVLDDDELELELPELDEDEDEFDVVVVELDVDVLVGTQFSVSDATTPETGGRLRLEIGVPGATLGTVKV